MICFDTDRPTFRAVMLHELAHLLNRDVNKTYFTWAIWWAFVGVALLPSVLKALRAPDDTLVNLIYLAGTAPVLTAVVYLNRNAVLRMREFYADVRASMRDGPTGALSRILATRSDARGWRLWALLSEHPSWRERFHTLENTHTLFRFGWWEAIGTGVVAILALFPVILLVSYLGTVVLDEVPGDRWERMAAIMALPLTLGPSLLVISLAIAAVGGGAWQATFAALVRGDTPREATRLGCGLAIGLVLGVLLFWIPGFGALMYSPIWVEVRLSPPSLVALVGFNAVWFTLLLTSLVLFFRWVMAGSSAWLQATLHSCSPSRFYLIGLLVTSGLFSLWFDVLFTGGLLSNVLLLWGSHTSIRVIGTTFTIVLLGALINPVTLLGFMSLWALPFAAWFWHPAEASIRAPSWLFLDSSLEPWIEPRQAPLHPGLGLLFGLGGGLVYCALLPLLRTELVPPAVMLGHMLHEEAVRQFGSDTFLPNLMKSFVVTGALAAPAAVLQACGATLVAAWVPRLGALHGLFATFVAGGVMTIGIRWLLADVSSELEFWLFWLPLVGNGGALMALAGGLAGAVMGKGLRYIFKPGRQG